MAGLDQDHGEGCLSESFFSTNAYIFFFSSREIKQRCFYKTCFPPSPLLKPCYSLAISSFQFTSCSVPWLMESLPCLFGYQGMKYSYCTLFQAEVIWVQRKWYLGLDFHSRLQLLKKKRRGVQGSCHLLGRQSISFHAVLERLHSLLMHWSKSALVRNLSRLPLPFIWLNT